MTLTQATRSANQRLKQKFLADSANLFNLMKSLRRLRFTFLALLAVLCLLGMQQGAAMHGLSHLVGENSTGQQKHLPHEKSCDKCIVYAEVSGGAPTTSHPVFAALSPFVAIALFGPQFLPIASHPVYSARAPPLSL